MHFDTFLLQKVGHHFCDTILDYCDPDQSAVNAAYREIEVGLRLLVCPVVESQTHTIWNDSLLLVSYQRRMPLQAAVIPKGLNLELDAGSDSDSDTGVPNAPASVAALLRKANNRRKGTKAGGKTKGRKKARNAGGKKRLAKARSALAMSSSSVGLRSKATAAIRKSDSSFALHRLMVEDSSGSFSAKPQLPPSGINSSGSSRARIGRSDGNGATQGRRKTRSTRASSSGSQGSRGSRGKTLSGRGKAGKTRVRSASSGSSGSQQQSGQQKAITPRAKAAAGSSSARELCSLSVCVFSTFLSSVVLVRFMDLAMLCCLCQLHRCSFGGAVQRSSPTLGVAEVAKVEIDKTGRGLWFCCGCC